jgi:hypothetical protein
MKRYLALSLILLFVSGCASPANTESANVTPTPKIIQVDNLKSCQMWQEAFLEFLDLSGRSDDPSNDSNAFWAAGIKMKNALQYADPKLKESMLVVATKFLSVTKEDIILNRWSTTPEQDDAAGSAIEFCESLGVSFN